MRYSPCENYLAVGSHDKYIYIYNVAADGNYTLKCKHDKHSSYVAAIDWTLDSECVRTYTGDHQTLYMNVKTEEYDPRGSETDKDKLWATNTMKINRDKEGILPPGEDKTHVNDCQLSKNHQFLFSSDDFGLINAFNFPKPSVKESRSWCGHSEHVSRCMLSPDQTKMFTIGGEDKTLIQWKVTGLDTSSYPIPTEIKPESSSQAEAAP